MRSYWGRRRFSIFSKMVVAFLLVISPLYFLGIVIINNGAQTVHDEITGSLQKQVRFYLASLENDIERITVLQREFMNDEDLESLSMLSERMSNYERLAAMKRLQTRLGMIQSSSVVIARAKAYIPAVSRTISSDRRVEPLDPGTLDQMKREVFHSTSPLTYSGGRLYIREFYPAPYYSDHTKPSFILEMEISLPSLESYLRQLPGYEGGNAILIHQGVVIARGQGRTDLEESLSATHSTQQAGALTVNLDSPKLGSSLVIYVPEEEILGPIRKYRVYMLLMSGISLVTLIAFAYGIYRIIHRPLRNMVGAFRKVEAGMFQVKIRHQSNDEFGYLYEKFNDMSAYLNKLIYEVYEQKIRLQHSELKQLQSQINPHFLYNSFYLLYRMTKAQDMESAERFTKFLGDYYQYITRNGEEEVRLEEEFHHVHTYIEIQSIRFRDRIRVTFGELPDSVLKMPVPRLILQPIVENAYQHGFNHDMKDCRLHIGIVMSQTVSGLPLLSVVVEDNGKGFTDEEKEKWSRSLGLEQPQKEGTGMWNVHRRLRLKYGKPAGITVEHRDPSGVKVLLTLPLATIA